MKLHTFIRCALVALLLAMLPTFAHAQGDEIDMTGARVYNSPGDLMRWPITARITSVTFTDIGFPTRHTRMEGPDAWGDQVTPGWDGPLQYTLGMCLKNKSDGQWDCSAVVQFWTGRQDADGNSTATPWVIGQEWFYDNRWGPLIYRGPMPGEAVGIFVCRGDCRGNVPPTRERSNIALVTWGQNYRASSSATQPPSPTPSPVPSQGSSPVPTQGQTPAPSVPVVAGLAQYDQLERVYRDLTDRDERVVRLLEDLQKRNEALAAQLKAHDEHPSWLARVFGNRYVQLALAAAGTYVGQAAAK